MIKLPKRIEIVFWNTAVKLMDKFSPVAVIIRSLYSVAQQKENLSFMIKVVGWTGCGFTFGLILGFLSHFTN
jgi:hypothetical protein